MRIALVISVLLLGSGCSEPNEDQYSSYPSPAYTPSPSPAAVPVAEIPSEPAALPRPSHLYDDNDGVFYSYIAAVSEEDRKEGKRAGDALTFAYLGKQDGLHVVAQVTPSGAILSRSSCREPCRVITYSDGRQIGFDKGSIIGAAFADAIAGELQVAEMVPTQRTAPAQHQDATPPVPAPTEPRWTSAEAILIADWKRLTRNCEAAVEAGQEPSQCFERDTKVGPKLAAADICYGMVEDESPAEFHRCTAGSLRFD